MKLVVHTFTSIDGVMQAPGGTEEDRTGGFDRGGWIVPFADADMGTIVEQWFSDADEILLGRSTYEKMRDYWSQVTDPNNGVARQLNSLPKHVVSNSLAEADWQNASIVSGDLAESVTALKRIEGAELQVHGSWQLVQTLHALDLVDEYRLLVFPLVLGDGKKLFEAGARPTAFELLEIGRTTAGATHVRLKPTAPPAYGDVVVRSRGSADTLTERT
jgi:dihydrofolate reductase